MRGLRYAWAMAVLSLCGIVPPPTRAGVTKIGDTYDNGWDFRAGYQPNATGTLTISAGSVFDRQDGYLGYATGSTGVATITGPGSTWTTSGQFFVGYDGSGTLRVGAGGQVSGTFLSYLGYNSGSTGTAIITGAGSNWTISNQLYADYAALHVGYSGSGSLRVEAGGQVSCALGILGYNSGSTGEAVVTGAGSKWTNSGELRVGLAGSGKLTVSDGGFVSAKTLYASLSDLHGNGTITVQSGGVLDADLSFNASHGLTQTLGFGSGGTLRFTVDGSAPLGIGYKYSGSLRIADGCSVASTSGSLNKYSTAIITGTGSKWTNSGTLSVGSGTLRVEAGAQVSDDSGSLAYNAGSTGTVVITGAGSKWTNSYELSVGSSGSGTLRVEAGGRVSSYWGFLAAYPYSMGAAVITGTGSKWTNSMGLYVGDTDSFGLYVGESGSASLEISDGGQVTTRILGIGSQSNLRLHVSGDRMLVLGDEWTTGSINIDDQGKLSLLADAFLPAGTYRPIAEYADRPMTRSGTGSTLAVGGTWDNSAQTFTVLPPTPADAATPATVSAGQRLLITDPTTGHRLGLSFGLLTSSTPLTSLPLPQTEQAALLPLLAPDESILSAWSFTAQLAGDEALLSFDIGLGAEDLHLWRRSETGWTAYTPAMLTYDQNGIVSFTLDPASLNSAMPSAPPSPSPPPSPSCSSPPPPSSPAVAAEPQASAPIPSTPETPHAHAGLFPPSPQLVQIPNRTIDKLPSAC